ncbi:short-chain dehydrogenase/reductase [Lichenifustis flavocetrariae]|uniref:Short-chain dehydrogenase/reductase n=1 Tax=Lichenifustis flavocetrariae TaxID=2949735 RepID=A0AA42CLB9_9HYPH|nr:short-chain dehydrogenase/reductase [Lichenifustis flavocetrariae]MCW6511449.1 short-chain dehydrogenase/reductase [Lichenifustis flavocetrariae]
MELNLRGKTALVTGGSKGIGLAIAAALASEGCAIHLEARTEATLTAAREAIRARYPVPVTLHALDLARSESVETLAERCRDIDILVNNAGAIPDGSLDTLDEKSWRAAWDLKVFGYVNMTRAFLGLMQQRGHGVILNIIGLAGERPDAGFVAGTAGNAALMAFTRAVGSTSLDHGVRVLAVNPGPVDTSGGLSDPALSQQSAGPRAVTARDVGDLVAFLVSERAASITGTIHTIDGGLGARRS